MCCRIYENEHLGKASITGQFAELTTLLCRLANSRLLQYDSQSRPRWKTQIITDVIDMFSLVLEKPLRDSEEGPFFLRVASVFLLSKDSIAP